MHAKFWHDRWENQQLGFHEGVANSLLVRHFDQLHLAEGSRVFVPFCGKTRDIAWLLSRGCKVVGAELSQLAITQLFDDLGIPPEISERGGLRHHHAGAVEVFVGDLFELTDRDLGPVDAIYDRAALVALPAALRPRYSQHLVDITAGAPQLLVTFEYDQELMEGPPFSLSGEEVHRHYADPYDVQLLELTRMPGKLREICQADESAWLLQRRSAETGSGPAPPRNGLR